MSFLALEMRAQCMIYGQIAWNITWKYKLGKITWQKYVKYMDNMEKNWKKNIWKNICKKYGVDVH